MLERTEPTRTLGDLQQDVEQCNDYLMWGTVDKAYKMLRDMNRNMADIVRHLRRMEAELERYADHE